MMKEPKLNDYTVVEWVKMVEDAKLQLKGLCPLIEESTLVEVNELLMYHSSQIREGFEADNEG